MSEPTPTCCPTPDVTPCGCAPLPTSFSIEIRNDWGDAFPDDEPPPPPAPVCDLTGDPVAVRLLRRLATRPWDQLHWCRLLDRIDELGLTHPFAADGVRVPVWLGYDPHRNRRALQRGLRQFRRMLTRLFGDFTAPVANPVSSTCEGHDVAPGDEPG